MTSCLFHKTTVIAYARCTVWLLAVSGLAARLDAHPFHTSLAEVEWNPQTQRIEVAIRIDAGDFERALRRMTGRQIILERLDELDKLAERYLRSRMEWRSAADGRAMKWHWVGSELQTRFVWVYFEIAVPPSTTSVRITQRLLCEIDPSQINMTVFRSSKSRTGTRFDARVTTVTVALPSMKVRRN